MRGSELIAAFLEHSKFVVHGGAVSALIDTAAMASWSAIEFRRRAAQLG